MLWNIVQLNKIVPVLTCIRAALSRRFLTSVLENLKNLVYISQLAD